MHKNLRIVVEGCCHGELDQIYASIALIEQESGQNVDLLICCGDFQAVRNKEDLKSMNVPSKYLTMASFHRYYSGEKVAPVLTIFIGGNHEASNHLQELYYGGWVAPNIYYLGCSGVVSVGGVRIAGISGIYNGRDYHRGHFEVPPYSPSTLRSIYHVREYEVFKLAQLASGSGARGDSAHVDVMLSHDWPRGIYHHGDMGQLLRTKPYFRKECETNTLGSQAAELLLNLLQPSYWFAGHLHCKFAAVVRHSSSTSQMSTPAKVTKFLALDKCLPNRDFLQLVEIPRPPDRWEQPVRLEYDLEWLAILRSTHSLLSRAEREVVLPRESRRVAPDDLEWVRARLAAACKRRGDDPSQALEIQPDAFVKTAPVHEPSSTDGLHGGGSLRGSPQTDALLKLLELGHRVTVPYTPCPPQAGAHVSQRSPSRRLESAQPGQRNSGEEEQRGTSLFFLDRGEDRGSSLPDPDSIDLDEVESAVCEDAVAQEYDRQEIVKPESEGGGGEDVIVFKGDHSPAHAAPGSQPSPRVHPSRPKLILPPPSLSD